MTLKQNFNSSTYQFQHFFYAYLFTLFASFDRKLKNATEYETIGTLNFICPTHHECWNLPSNMLIRLSTGNSNPFMTLFVDHHFTLNASESLPPKAPDHISTNDAKSSFAEPSGSERMPINFIQPTPSSSSSPVNVFRFSFTWLSRPETSPIANN